MKLLNTHTLGIKEFNDRDDMPSYAILSHVWDGAEQSYQDIMALIEGNEENGMEGEGSWGGVSEKLTNFCKTAAEFGYDWGWCDTCCIDKTSSAELSEAINSMFAWYAEADVCIAYLADVEGDMHSPNAAPHVGYSRWFTRGWTLQELIAPSEVVFVTQQWHIIGSRTALADIISGATHISTEVLTVPGAFARESVLQRFIWAHERETTRVEDRAYSLMGLFGVNMTTIYGEGGNAFRRLQEEILKSSNDQTLFSWGVGLSDSLGDDMESGSWPAGLLVPDLSVLEWNVGLYVFPKPLPIEDLPKAVGAFMSVLYRAIRQANGVPPTDEQPVPSMRYDVPTFNLTSHGVRAKIPLIRLKEGAADVPAIGVLACQNDGAYVGMFLHHCSTVAALPVYGVGVPPALYPRLELDEGMVTCNRLVFVSPPGNATHIPAWPVQVGLAGNVELSVDWEEIYISHVFGGYPAHTLASDNVVAHTVFDQLPIIPSWVLVKLVRAGFALRSPDVHGTGAHALNTGEHTAPSEGDGACSASFAWTSTQQSSRRPPTFTVHIRAERKWRYQVRRDVFEDIAVGVAFDGSSRCTFSDVGEWEHGVHKFGDDDRQVRLRLSPGKSQGECLLDIDIGGSEYGLPTL